MGKYWVLVGFGALFFLCGSASLCAAYSWRQRVKRSFSWPSVQGRVLKSEFGESDKIGSGSGSSYAPVVEYEYIPLTTYSTPTTISKWEVTLPPRVVPRKNVPQPTPLGAR